MSCFTKQETVPNSPHIFLIEPSQTKTHICVHLFDYGGKKDKVEEVYLHNLQTLLLGPPQV